MACDSGYAGLQGRVAVINLTSLTLDTVLNLGTSAIGTYSVYSYANSIFTVNKTPYGGGNIGSITKLNPTTGAFTTNVLALNVGTGIGIGGNLLYLCIGKSVGSYNLDTQQMVDTAIIHFFGQANSIEVHSAALDYVNARLYTNLGNRTSLGVGVVFSLTGDSLANYTTGINADACAIDFRTPTGIASNGSVQEAISVFPNPAADYISIITNSSSTLREVKILDLTGRTVETKQVQKGENSIRISISDNPAGVYLISFTTDQGTKVRKFIKR